MPKRHERKEKTVITMDAGSLGKRSEGRVSEGALQRVCEFAREYLGFFYHRRRMGDVARRLVQAAGERGLEDADRFVETIFRDLSHEDRVLLVASILTVGETYFFRDLRLLEAFSQRLLPEMIRRKEAAGERRLCFWSAGCSSGEEAYTLAMIVSEAVQGRKDWNVLVLASDVNPRALDAARAAVYRSWSFRKAVPARYAKYVAPAGDGLWEVVPSVRTLVKFFRQNLADPALAPPEAENRKVDGIFCRNVLMYFDPEKRSQVLDRLHGGLAEGAWLMVSAQELHFADPGRWERVRFPGAIFLRKIPRIPKFRTPTDSSAPDRSEGRADVQRPGGMSIRVSGGTGARRDRPGMAAASDLVCRSGKSPGLEEHGEPGAESPEAGVLSALEEGRLAEAVVLVNGILSRKDAGAGSAALRDAITALVQELANAGRRKEALDLVNRIAARHKLEPGYPYLKAVLCRDMGDTEGAVAAYRQVLYLDPQAVPALLGLGTLHQAAGKKPLAARYFERALEALDGWEDGEAPERADGLSPAEIRRIAERFL